MLKLCCTGMKNLIFLLVFSLFTIARCMWESRTASIKKLAHKRKFRMKYTETMAKNQRIQRLLHSWSTICLQFACRNEIISVYNILCTVLYTLCHILWKKSTFFLKSSFFALVFLLTQNWNGKRQFNKMKKLLFFINSLFSMMTAYTEIKSTGNINEKQ